MSTTSQYKMIIKREEYKPSRGLEILIPRSNQDILISENPEGEVSFYIVLYSRFFSCIFVWGVGGTIFWLKILS